MRLNELLESDDDEPLIITLAKQQMEKGDRIARYYMSGNRKVAGWISGFKHVVTAPIKGMRADDVWQAEVWHNGQRTYVGYNADTLSDGTYELVKHPTLKKIWIIQRAKKSVTEAQGSEVMAFTDYLTRKHILKKLVPEFEKVGTMLFKRGYTFGENGHGTGIFINEGALMKVAFPSAANARRDLRDTISISYDWLKGAGPHCSHEPYEVGDLQTDDELDAALAKVKADGDARVAR